MLCSFAIRNLEKFGTRLDPKSKQLVQRGLLINYDSLPGYVPQVLLPLFGINPLPSAWLDKISEESAFYSKSRGAAKKLKFTGDSKDKDDRATANIQLYAEKILSPTYLVLQERALEALNNFAPSFVSEISAKSGQSVDTFTWKTMSALPSNVNGLILRSQGLIGGPKGKESGSGDSASSAADLLETNAHAEQADAHAATSLQSSQLKGVGHSTALKEKEFVPWAPFANHHHSKPFSVGVVNLTF